MKRRYLLGLTGGLASGKSTVARWLAEAGFRVIDADLVVAELYAAGGAGAKAVKNLFGPDCLTPEGAVKHTAVARRIFADPEARRQLEAAIHPLVRQHFRHIAKASEGIVVLEATLLVEAGYGEDFDLVITIEADIETRLDRAISRGMEAAAARSRLDAQGDGVQRRAGADRIVRNDGSLEELRRKIDTLVGELRLEVSESSR